MFIYIAAFAIIFLSIFATWYFRNDEDTFDDHEL